MASFLHGQDSLRLIENGSLIQYEDNFAHLPNVVEWIISDRYNVGGLFLFDQHPSHGGGVEAAMPVCFMS